MHVQTRKRSVHTPLQAIAPTDDLPADRFLSDPDLDAITGLSRTTRWRLEKQGLFPKKISISPGRKAVSERALRTWMAERIAASITA